MSSCRTALTVGLLLVLGLASPVSRSALSQSAPSKSVPSRSVLPPSASAQSPETQSPFSDSQAAPPAPTVPMRVTTDTPEYCDRLADRVAEAEHSQPKAPPQAEELAAEGHHMCAIGLIRGGLARLRRALVMLQPDQ
jgi:hypothetical protein